MIAAHLITNLFFGFIVSRRKRRSFSHGFTHLSHMLSTVMLAMLFKDILLSFG